MDLVGFGGLKLGWVVYLNIFFSVHANWCRSLFSHSLFFFGLEIGRVANHEGPPNQHIRNRSHQNTYAHPSHPKPPPFIQPKAQTEETEETGAVEPEGRGVAAAQGERPGPEAPGRSFPRSSSLFCSAVLGGFSTNCLFAFFGGSLCFALTIFSAFFGSSLRFPLTFFFFLKGVPLFSTNFFFFSLFWGFPLFSSNYVSLFLGVPFVFH